ncbi:MAG TPA: rubredoxin, partial [Firmicutes bacterium]|nr:rubredoxin [Bacillota bacterium]
MVQTVQLKNDVHWLGMLDPDLDVFDIIMETKYGTTYNSYLVNTHEGAILVETVKEKYFGKYLEKIKEVVGDLSQVKYIITNHTEPDHAGSIGRLIDVCPDITVIGSKTAINYLKELLNKEFNYLTAESLKTFELGGKSFEFISAPFLHWPDSMYTYLSTDNILFTCDSFGSHYSPKEGILLSEVPQSEEANYQDALLYYYTAIFSPFKPYVIKALAKIKDLTFDMICNGHGPVLDTRIDEILETYRTWSTPAPKKETKKVVMPYVSAYGYTEELAQAIAAGIKEVDESIEIEMYNLDILNYTTLKDTVLASFADADGILLGTCTINGDALPIIWDLAVNLNPIVHGGKVVSAFGSYGWSGEGVSNIMDRLNQLRMKVVDGFKIKFRASESEVLAAKKFGQVFGQSVVSGKVPPRKKSGEQLLDVESLNPSGKVVLWRCVICGEVYPGVVPPEVCPACG